MCSKCRAITPNCEQVRRGADPKKITKMLVATPAYVVGFDKLPMVGRAPRIVSEIKKQEHREPMRARISGELMVLVGGEMRWCQRRVTVRGGQLILAGCPGELSSALRIPLRQLSLQAGPLPNSLSLVKGKTVLLTLQTSNERSFDLWVKTVAIEVIRQTPLESVRYLDIFTLTENSEKRKSNHPLESPPPTPSCIICPPPNEPSDCNRNTTVINRNLLQPPNAKPSPAVDVLLQRCQSTENYVPVKEKLALFESLCRIGRVKSTEDVSFKVDVGTKRARSMHDLTYCFSTAGVREMCKYFETKLDDEPGCGGRKRFINSDSNLSKVKFTFSRTLQDVSYA